MRKLTIGIWMWIIFSIISTSCTKGGPTSIDPVIYPYFEWHGNPTEQQINWTNENFERLAACIKLDPHSFAMFPIYILDERFYCWSAKDNTEVAAAGCAYPDHIKVRREWAFENGGAVLTELMHVSLWKQHENAGYDNPKFTTCRWW